MAKRHKKYVAFNKSKGLRNSVALGTLLASLTGCGGGDDKNTPATESVWRAYPSTHNYSYLEDQNVSLLNLIEGDGTNDLASTGYVDFLTEPEARNYVDSLLAGSGSSSSGSGSGSGTGSGSDSVSGSPGSSGASSSGSTASGSSSSGSTASGSTASGSSGSGSVSDGSSGSTSGTSVSSATSL